MDACEQKTEAKIYDLRNYALTKRVLFNFDLLGNEVSDEDALQIPVGIVYRLYFLGRAYNFPALKMVEPKGRSYLGYSACRQLVTELRQLLSVLRDPVAEHYLKKLVSYLETNQHDPDKGLLVRSL